MNPLDADATAPSSGRAHASTPSHGNPKLHLAVNIIHLLATMGAMIETARALGGWLHLFQG